MGRRRRRVHAVDGAGGLRVGLRREPDPEPGRLLLDHPGGDWRGGDRRRRGGLVVLLLQEVQDGRQLLLLRRFLHASRADSLPRPNRCLPVPNLCPLLPAHLGRDLAVPPPPARRHPPPCCHRGVGSPPGRGWACPAHFCSYYWCVVSVSEGLLVFFFFFGCLLVCM